MGNTDGEFCLASLTTVHPHTRGEHSGIKERLNQIAGSSPHSWGTLRASRCVPVRGRFIPTLVGNTFSPKPIYAYTAVHPHTRGEHSPTGRPSSLNNGSSPHSWGTRVDALKKECDCRFIPTLVGNTPPSRLNADCRAVHPHTRGEHGERACWSDIRGGSSPHSWGTPQQAKAEGLPGRFIPTLVGNTSEPSSLIVGITVHPHTRGEHGLGALLPRPKAVHPHTRGEHLSASRVTISTTGSSPHSWGTPRRTRRACVRNRFIPTLVGNTGAAGGGMTEFTVHPHTRGEHLRVPRYPDLRAGSSPHSWGTRHHCRLRCRRKRFIPTLVGNTPESEENIEMSPVHPHTRGEHHLLKLLLQLLYGSSPHSWGTPQ